MMDEVSLGVCPYVCNLDFAFLHSCTACVHVCTFTCCELQVRCIELSWHSCQKSYACEAKHVSEAFTRRTCVAQVTENRPAVRVRVGVCFGSSGLSVGLQCTPPSKLVTRGDHDIADFLQTSFSNTLRQRRITTLQNSFSAFGVRQLCSGPRPTAPHCGLGI